jgi:RimJ/RimL family protein N-acetyltransferase
MFIRTERLFLRPGWIEDARELARAIAHEPVVRMLARAPWPYGEADARAFLESSQDPRLPSLIVTLPAERGRIIGGCGLHRGESGEVEVGYWITPDQWGKGYAREALGGLLGAAPLLGHRRIAARHALDNPASGSVLRANGFRPTGRTTRYHSLGRADEVSSVEYALQLAPATPSRQDWTRAMAYAAEAGLGAAA